MQRWKTVRRWELERNPGFPIKVQWSDTKQTNWNKWPHWPKAPVAPKDSHGAMLHIRPMEQTVFLSLKSVLLCIYSTVPCTMCRSLSSPYVTPFLKQTLNTDSSDSSKNQVPSKKTKNFVSLIPHENPLFTLTPPTVVDVLSNTPAPFKRISAGI